MIKLKGLTHGNQYLLTHRFGLAGRLGAAVAQILQHDHEVITAQTRHRVALANAMAQARRRALQQQVALVMPLRVVDLFEAIQVDEQQRAVAVVARITRQRMFEPVDQ